MFFRILFCLFIIFLFSNTFAKDIENKSMEKKSTILKVFKKIFKKGSKKIYTLNMSHSNYYSIINIEDDSIDVGVRNKILNLLYEHLSIIHKINTKGIDEEQIIYLKEDTPSEVDQILASFGFIKNKVKVVVNKEEKILKIDIQLDERVIVNSYKIKITGSIIKDEDYKKYYKMLNDNWVLTKGKFFNQDDWEKSKISSLVLIKRDKYPLAKITKSEAKVNIDTHKADLILEIYSGNLIRFGDINIEGLKRYPKSIVTGLATFKINDYYNFDRALDFQKSLGYDSHFESAIVNSDFDNIKNDKVPIKVELEELPKNKLDVGVGRDSVEGIVTYVGYSYFNLFNKGYVNSIVFNNNRYEQNFSVGLSQPMYKGNQYYTVNANLANKKRRNVDSKRFSTGIWKVYVDQNFEYRIGVQYFLENSKITDYSSLGRSYLTMLTSSIKYNNIYPKLRPENGIYIFGNLGTTIGKFLSTSSMQKYYLDSAYYFTPYEKLGTFVFRNTLGYIYILEGKNKILEVNIPTDILFKTGGSGSVRGYDFESIGINGPNDSTLGGRALLVLSGEYQIPINYNFSFAIFHDAGDVKNKFSDFKLYHSTGIGIRWFNMLAPVSFDIAYKHKNDDKLKQKHKNIGWYITLGAHF